MKQVRLLLAGVGGYGCAYLREWERMNDESVAVEGICDIMPGLEERFPVIKEKNIPIYPTLEAFYENHEADLAILATPIHLHHTQGVYCMEHGSNVLVEKPICTTMEEVEDFLKKEEETGKFLSVGYQMNYDPDMKALKQDILDGAFGKPLRFKTIHCYRRGEWYYHRNDWAGKIRANGRIVNDGPVSNSNAHQFQNMLFLLGDTMERATEVADVRAELYRANAEVENYDTAAFEVMTTCGVPVFYYTTHECQEPEFGPKVEFQFEDAMIRIELDEEGVRRYVARWNDGRQKIYGGVINSQSLHKMYEAIECTRNGGHPVCTAQTAGSHLDVVARLAQYEIKDIAPEHLEPWEGEGDQWIHIRDLEEIFGKCFEKNVLPAENGVQW